MVCRMASYLYHRRRVILSECEQDADASVEMLTGTHTADILVETT